MELNLSYQIKANFHDYMDIMINLNTISVEIAQALKNISYLRKYNKDLRTLYIQTSKIQSLKVRAMNMERLLGIVLFLKFFSRNKAGIAGDHENRAEELLIDQQKYAERSKWRGTIGSDHRIEIK